MTPFTCGCTDAPTYCDMHAFMECHTPQESARGWGECPPCRLSRLRSVSLDGRATPTRRKG